MLSFSLFSKIVQSGEFHFLTIGGLISFSSPDIKKDCEIGHCYKGVIIQSMKPVSPSNQKPSIQPQYI